jgi:hypothetical protein
MSLILYMLASAKKTMHTSNSFGEKSRSWRTPIFATSKEVAKMLLEWEFSAKERTYLEKLDIPEDLVEKAKASGIRIEDGTRIPVEITNKDTGERYRARLAVTSNGELYVPVEVQKLIKDSESVRVELL